MGNDQAAGLRVNYAVEWYRIYEIEAGFVVADHAGWRDGVFDTIEEARASIADERQ